MRRAILLSLIILLSQPLVSATDISTDTEEDTGGTLSGTYTVKDGATWTISGDYELEDDTSIVVEEGGMMIVSGAMDAISPPELQLAQSANVIVPVGNLGESGTMRIHFTSEIIYGINIEINGTSTEEWKDSSEFDQTIGMDVDSIAINITGNTFTEAVISHITLSPQGSAPVIRNAEELSGNGTSVVIPDRQKAWSLDVQGGLVVSGSMFGGMISCSGTCTLDGAEMKSSGPIEVTGAISVTNSVFDSGIVNEDITVIDDATVEWINSNGTGGETDNWVRILSSRTIGVQNGYVTFYGYGIGYDSRDTSPLSDNNTFDNDNMADNQIDIDRNSNSDRKSRIIEWRDGAGNEETEQASGLLILVTPWGDYEHVIDDLPRVNHFDVTIDTPLLSFDSLIESDDENGINSRLGVMATVTNNGNAPASFLIDCISNGTDANVGVNVPHTILAEETLEIPMNWDSAYEGELTLECTIFVPYQLENFVVITTGSATTGNVTWSEVEDNSSNLVIPISIGVVLAIVLFVIVARSRMKMEIMKEHLSSISVSLTDEIDEDSDEDMGTIE